MRAAVDLSALKYSGNALAATNAHGHQGVAPLDAMQFMQGLDRDQSARGPNRVAQ